MKHVFGIKDELCLKNNELTPEELDSIAGGVSPKPIGIGNVTNVVVEEGGKPIFPYPYPPIATTLALGEEGGSGGGVTTYAIGEEGGFPITRS